MIKLRLLTQRDYPELPEGDLKPTTSGIIRDREDVMHTERRRQCDHASKEWRNVATSQEMLAATRS